MNTRTALIGAALAIVAIAALIVLSGSEDDDGGTPGTGGVAKTMRSPGGAGEEARQPGRAGEVPPQAETGVPTIVVGEDGEPVGGVAELSYEKDEQVRFKVESSVADHVHVHGYDLMKDVEPGGAVTFEFRASLEGVFEAELEDRGEQILELRVEP